MQLNEVYLMGSYTKLAEYKHDLIEKGKYMSELYLLPLYITLKATILVSKEIIMEMIQTRFNTIKMTYEVSKDSVTMFVSGDFN